VSQLEQPALCAHAFTKIRVDQPSIVLMCHGCGTFDVQPVPPAAHPPEGSREPQKWPCRVAKGTQCSSEMCEPPTPPPGPVQDGRHLPTHAVMWLVVNERICRKQHAPTEPHEWERATFSPAPEGE
jgi:hypothetical protein